MGLKYTLSTVLVLLGLFLSVTAQDKLLSKGEAAQLTLENNFGIQIAENQVEQAKNNKSLLNTGFLPTLSGNASASYNRDDQTTEFPGQFVTDENGEFVLDDDGNRVPEPDIVLEKAEGQLYSSALALDYLLFDGLGRRYNYKRLKEEYQLSELQARETIENTLVQLFTVYFEVARLTENERVFQQAMDVSKDRIVRAQYAFEYGQNTKLDILNAQVDATNDSINLLNTIQDLNNAKRDLNVVLNRNLSEAFKVDTLVTFMSLLDLRNYAEDYKRYNVTVLQAEQNLLISDYDVKFNKSDFLPTLSLNGSYGWSLNQSAPSAFFPGTNATTYNLNLGASLVWNIFDGGGTITRVKNARISFMNQELQKKQTLIEVDRDIKNAMTIYENLLNIYQIQEQNVITNQNNFDRSKEQFELGRITSIEFRQAQINLLDAQTNKNLAKYDAKLGELQLLQLTGQLLNVEL